MKTLIVTVTVLASSPTEEYFRLGRGDARVERGYGRGSGLGLAFFEFAPANGAGLASTCGGTSTGAKGEPLTVSRTTPQGCFDPETGTGCIVGANTLCAVNGGTTASQGSFIESTVRTSELENAAWSAQNSGLGNPTVTANYGTAPEGTLTAERVQVPATGAAEYSLLYQPSGCPVSTTGVSASCWVRGVSSSGTTDMVLYTGAAFSTSSCAYTNAKWSLCKVENATTVAGPYIAIGNGSSINGGIARGAADILVTDCNCVNSANVRPYIQATSIAVTTDAERLYATITAAPALNSMEVTADVPTYPASSAVFMEIYKDGSNFFEMYYGAGGKLGCFWYVGATVYEGLSAGAISLGATHRLSCSYDGANVIACVDGSCNSTAKAFVNFSGAQYVYIGTYASAGYELSPNRIIKGVKADPNPTRFR